MITAEGVCQQTPGKACGPAASGILPVHCLLVVAALAAAVTAQGAYYATGQLVVGVLLVGALASALRASPRRRREVDPVLLLPWAGLVAWAVISAIMAGQGVAAGPTVAVLAGCGAVLAACRRSTRIQREGLAVAALALGALAAVSGWAGVAWRLAPWALQDQGLWRAATTLTYANAAAGLLAPLSLLALARLLSRPRAPLRVATAALLLVGTGATLSRGGALALAAGVAVLVVVLGARRVVRAVGPAVVGAAVALGGLAPSMPAAGPPRPLLAAVALALGLVAAGCLSLLPGRALAAAALAVTMAVPVALAYGGSPADTVRAIGGQRLTVASPDRAQAAHAGLSLTASRPLTGVGPGRAMLVWGSADGRTQVTRYAHNEYLQTLVELGAVGLVLLLAMLATVARSVWRGRTSAVSPEIWAGVAAGLVALAVHSGAEFLWHLPVIPLTGALLVGISSPTTLKEQL